MGWLIRWLIRIIRIIVRPHPVDHGEATSVVITSGKPELKKPKG